jgi:hypothetical protein
MSFVCAAIAAGCGTAVQRNGTEQLLLSDAVDRAVDQLDLSPLAGRRVYLDTEYMKPVKGNMFINSEYINSSLRQKMTTSGIQIHQDRTTADYVLEARVGALGSDSMEVTYGIPSSGGVGQAASAIAGAPAISIPEVSFGKRNANIAVSKLVVFAYHRETGVPVWQSGSAVAKSDSQDSWMLGVGPLTRGSVHEGYRFAGKRLWMPFSQPTKSNENAPLTIADRYHFVHPAVLEKQLADAKAMESGSPGSVHPVSHENAPPEPPGRASP